LKIKIRNELVIIVILTFILVAFIVLIPSDVVRIILGLPFLLFFPGYTLMAAIFPKREGIGGVLRVALSFGISLAVVPLIVFSLNYTALGIRLEPILYSVAAFILVTSIVGWLRRRRLPETARFVIEFELKAPRWSGSVSYKVLFITLVVVVVGALVSLVYVLAAPGVGETFTEFYLLGLDGKVGDYPEEIRVGETSEVIVVVVNHEQETVSYRVEVRIDGVKDNEVGPFILDNEQKWEEVAGFTPDKVGDNQRVEFSLYKAGETLPCLEPLHLWINVTD